MQETLGQPRQAVMVVIALLVLFLAGVALPLALEAQLPYYVTKLTVVLLVGGIVLLALKDTLWAFAALFLGWSLFNSINFSYFQYGSQAWWVNLFVLGAVILIMTQIARAIVFRTPLNYKLRYWDIALSIFFLLSVLGVTVAQNIPITLSLSTQFVLSAVLVHRLVSQELRNRERVSSLLWVIAGTSALIATIALAEAFLLPKPFISYLPGFGLNAWQQTGFYGFAGEFPHRAWSTLGNPLPSGGYLAMFLPLVLFLMESSKGMGKTIARIAGAVVVLGILATVARGAAVSSGMVLLVWYLSGTIHGRVRALFGAVGVFLGLALTFLIPNPLGGALLNRFTQEEVYNINLYHRLNSYATVGNVLRESPLLGIGYGHFDTRYQEFQAPGTELIYTPDNYFLRVLAETGVIGLVVLVSGFLWLILYLFRGYLSKTDPFTKRLVLATLLGVLVLVLESFTFDTLGNPNIALSFFALVGIGFGSLNQLKSTETESNLSGKPNNAS